MAAAAIAISPSSVALLPLTVIREEFVVLEGYCERFHKVRRAKNVPHERLIQGRARKRGNAS